MTSGPAQANRAAVSAETSASVADAAAPAASDVSGSWRFAPEGVGQRAVWGYQQAPTLERAGLGMLTSFAVTIGVARVINYVRERRRNVPMARSWVRRSNRLAGGEPLRVHHFVPGVGMAFLAGGAAIVTRGDRREVWFSLPFGMGVGLAFDEIAVMTAHGKRYWQSQKLVIAHAAAAALGGLALATRMYIRGPRVG